MNNVKEIVYKIIRNRNKIQKISLRYSDRYYSRDEYVLSEGNVNILIDIDDKWDSKKEKDILTFNKIVIFKTEEPLKERDTVGNDYVGIWQDQISKFHIKLILHTIKKRKNALIKQAKVNKKNKLNAEIKKMTARKPKLMELWKEDVQN